MTGFFIGLAVGGILGVGIMAIINYTAHYYDDDYDDWQGPLPRRDENRRRNLIDS